MSEFINNREKRQEQLKALIMKLHDGASVEDVKDEFQKMTIDVSPTEITQMEQALVDEGMPVEEIQRLCDVHASVFKGSIEEIHASVEGKTVGDMPSGHPIDTFRRENRLIEALLDDELDMHLGNFIVLDNEKNKNKLLEVLKKVGTIDKHYSRKENLIFPYMEKYDITAPPQVMWGVDDEIRDKIKSVFKTLMQGGFEKSKFEEDVKALAVQINEMIFKEEQIMFPMISEVFSEQEWIAIEKASEEIGFTLLGNVDRWDVGEKSDSEALESPNKEASSVSFAPKDSDIKVQFDAGMLSAQEINAILNTVPLDMTFVGADDRVKYFTQGKERVFDRPQTIIGREVKHCHPPKSVHIVEKIVEDLKSGKKDNEDFWIKMGDMFAYIRYFAVRNKQGEFLGTLEVTQNIKPITELEGEKRLMS